MLASLRSLSDKVLLSHTVALIAQEREATLLVLLHLIEIERRGLHLSQGFQSLHDYCTAGLGYSSSAAYRRIQTAQCITRFPDLVGMLQRNEVNLSTVAQVSRSLTSENHDELLSRIRGKSQREVETILAECHPGAMPRDRVRTIVVRVPASPAPDREPELTPVLPSVPASDACEKSAYCRNGNESVEAAVEKRVMLQFAVRPEFMNKLNKVRSLAWHRLRANASLEEVFELAMDLMLAKEDPAKRIERREKRAQRNVATTSSKNPRHIPAPVRDQVFEKYNGQCAFVAPGGRRCGSTRALQVDHIRPVARGGASTIENLRLLCAYHNRMEAERLMGRSRPPRQSGSMAQPQPGRP